MVCWCFFCLDIAYPDIVIRNLFLVVHIGWGDKTEEPSLTVYGKHDIIN